MLLLLYLLIEVILIDEDSLVISGHQIDAILPVMDSGRLFWVLNHWNRREFQLLLFPEIENDANLSNSFARCRVYIIPNNASRIFSLIMYTISSSSCLLLLLRINRRINAKI
jgi:hypothetical protein